jgi:hypothetical protein
VPANTKRRQTVETRRVAALRETDSKPARPRSGERSYVASLKCYVCSLIGLVSAVNGQHFNEK